MTDTLEAQLRVALEAKALEVDVPEDLAGRTIEAVRALRPQRSRRWMYISGAGLAAVAMVIGGVLFLPSRAKQESLAQRTSSDVGAPSGDTNHSASAGALSASTGMASSGGHAVTPLNDLPKLVRNATISVRVDNFERSWPQANDLALTDGGFVTDSKTSETDGGSGSGSLTIRVPSDRLDEALRDLRHLGTMTELMTSGEDVSAPMADLAARKKTAEAEEAQLQNLLQSAGSVADVLDIRSRLNDTRNEIESIEGQIRSYQNRIDYATINATVFSKGAAPGKPLLGSTIGRSFHTARHVGAMFVAGSVIVLGGLLPLAALAALGWFVLRAVRRRSI